MCVLLKGIWRKGSFIAVYLHSLSGHSMNHIQNLAFRPQCVWQPNIKLDMCNLLSVEAKRLKIFKYRQRQTHNLYPPLLRHSLLASKVACGPCPSLLPSFSREALVQGGELTRLKFEPDCWNNGVRKSEEEDQPLSGKKEMNSELPLEACAIVTWALWTGEGRADPHRYSDAETSDSDHTVLLLWLSPFRRDWVHYQAGDRAILGFAANPFLV